MVPVGPGNDAKANGFIAGIAKSRLMKYESNMKDRYYSGHATYRV
jgi:hypothetical protein